MKHNEQSSVARDQSLDPSDWKKFRALAHSMLDSAIAHVEGAGSGAVWNPVPDEVKQELAEPVPMEAQGAEKVCQDLVRLVLPYSTGNKHPRFFGWVHGAGMPGGIIAEICSAAMNANLGGRDHGAIYVERQVIDWCRQMFGLPGTAGGLLVSGTSMATLIALTTARYAKSKYNVRQEGVRPDRGRLVGYTSRQAHSCIARTFDIIGLGQEALRSIPTDDSYRMDIDALREAIAKDKQAGHNPFCVVGTAGAVNVGAIDDLEAIAQVAREHDLWFHIDGAFGAMANLSENLRPRLKGIAHFDSLAFDFHKWLHVQYDAGCVLIRDGKLQQEAFTLRPEYLAAADRGLAGGNPWFCEFGPELSRGFRALKVWFALKEHGVKRLAQKIEENCEQAVYLSGLVEGHDELEMMAPVALNIACFRFVAPAKSDAELDHINGEIVIDLQEKGIAVPSTTRLGERLAIRVNITNHRSRRADFDTLVDAIVQSGRRLSSAG